MFTQSVCKFIGIRKFGCKDSTSFFKKNVIIRSKKINYKFCMNENIEQ